MPKKTRTNKHDISSTKNTTRRKLKIQPKTPSPISNIVNTISSMNPFNSDDKLSCEDKRCPVGFRCDEDKTCYKLTEVELSSNGKQLVLSVDGHRAKKYDIDMLNRNFDRVYYLKNGLIDGKNITGTRLKNLIADLKTRVKGDVKSTYYGTLNDEMIIQIIHLEEMERMTQGVSTDETITKEIPDSVSVEPELKQIVNIDENGSKEHESPFEEPLVEPPVLNEEQFKIPDMQTNATNNENAIQDKIGIPPDNIESAEFNKFMTAKELAERENLKLDNNYDFLYPELNDPNFNVKIAKRKEFNDTQYDGKIYDIKAHAEQMCDAEFELMPHQLFVKNFMSFQTPYNSLLLYHGLGTGKTCSAIGIAEEMRSYMKQTGISQRIIVIASPNVQNNFRMQIFDEKKLSNEGGNWNLNTCIGNTLLKEINPSQIQNMSRDKVISQINSLISQYYIFMGYGEFANYIKRKTAVDAASGLDVKQQKLQEINKIQSLFNNRLIIIDEVHNLRVMQENKEAKKASNLLMRICKYAQNIRLLLLSATPLFNNHREIIWLTNLLNAVDKRGLIEEKDVFNADGQFTESRTLPDGTKVEGGEELLRRKLTGYISYVRGENPYTFPYRIYPVDFAPDRQISYDKYPSLQMNNKEIEVKPSKTPLYVDTVGEYQKAAYDFIMNHLIERSYSTTDVFGKEREMPTFENMESFGYTIMREPLQALNMVFPVPEFDAIRSELPQPASAEETPGENETAESETQSPDTSPTNSENSENSENNNNNNNNSIVGGGESIDSTDDDDKMKRYTAIINSMIGKEGLSSVVTYTHTKTPFELRYNFKYKPETVAKYGQVFHPKNIHKYSGKIASICENIKKSTGIIMIYSQFIDGGVVPIALALEEMGFTRYGFASHTKSLFEVAPTEPVDSTTFKTLAESEDKTKFRPAKYVMITGDKSFSPNNLADLKYITDPANKNGELVRVVLITKAAAEGLDFKNIRQLHILDPWYNMNRVEQIIGRGVRNLSHCMLPFEERNVEIYLHATKPTDDKETADLYIYRYAENKAVEIGKITRIMKETAVDCILNIGQTSFTIDKLNALAENQNIKLKLSSNQEINYKIGDKEGSGICDYMNCDFVCSPMATIADTDINKTTYGEHYIKMNYNAIAKRIRDLFKEQTFYSREQLLLSIQIKTTFPIEQIDYVLSTFIENSHNYLVDKYGRNGFLINAGEYYGFQPLELTDVKASVLDRSVPIEYKPNEMYMELPLNKEEIHKTQEPSISVDDEPKIMNVEKIERTYQSLYKELDICLKTIKFERINHKEGKLMETAESDWYKHMGHVYDELVNHVNIPDEYIQKYIIYHWIDMQLIQDKLTMLTYLYKIESYIPSTTVESVIKSYFDGKMFQLAKERSIALGGDNHINMYVQIIETRQWKKAEAAVVRKYQDKLREKYHIDVSKIQPFVGFMHMFKKNEMTFKMKEIVKQTTTGKPVTANKGFKCSVMGKNEIVKFMNNKVLAKDPYKMQNGIEEITKYDVNTNAKNIMRVGLCVMMELIMRYFNDNSGPNNLKWFFDVEETLANDLPKL